MLTRDRSPSWPGSLGPPVGLLDSSMAAAAFVRPAVAGPLHQACTMDVQEA
jgi:hypothetical protein